MLSTISVWVWMYTDTPRRCEGDRWHALHPRALPPLIAIYHPPTRWYKARNLTNRNLGAYPTIPKLRISSTDYRHHHPVPRAQQPHSFTSIPSLEAQQQHSCNSIPSLEAQQQQHSIKPHSNLMKASCPEVVLTITKPLHRRSRPRKPSRMVYHANLRIKV